MTEDEERIAEKTNKGAKKQSINEIKIREKMQQGEKIEQDIS